MKTCKRWIAVLLAVLMCLSLCGCQALEDMRAAQAVYQEDGSILWNGQVYRMLGDTASRGDIYIVGDNQNVYVTQKDVPVLLSEFFGEPYDVCADGTLLESYTWDGGYIMYCREDVYDATAEYLKNGFQLDTYFYSYYDEETYDGNNYYLTEYQTNAVNDVLANVIPAPLETYEDEAIWDSLYLNGCDESHRFSQNYLMDLWITEDGYFLVVEEDVYPVPEAYNGIFNDITKAYVESMGDWSGPPTYVVS